VARRADRAAAGGRARDQRQALEAQRRALAAACRRRGWRLVAGERLARGAGRPPATEAEHTILTVSRRAQAEQLLLELARLLASAEKQGWALSGLDRNPEPPSAEGAISVRATFAPCEQQLLSTRIKAALARARADGVRLGRRPGIPTHILTRIDRERNAGKSLAQIANGLNADRIPTAQGGRRWYPATIRHALNRTP
jgi:DNA invertase Pin-like site-specific DNA recombinase